MTPFARAVLARLLGTFLLSLLFGFAVSEISYRLSRSEAERIPEVITIVIPAGAAEQISRGLPGPEMPEMKFLEGDQIVVVNQDQVSHQLGPMWIPPGASSSLTLDRPSQYEMACSFQAAETLAIDVQPRARTSDRVVGALAIGLPTWALLALYAIVASPLPPRTDSTAGRFEEK